MMTGFSSADVAASFVVLEEKIFGFQKSLSKNFYKFRIFENLM
ncbi:hypothetical protein [Acetobacter persici]